MTYDEQTSKFDGIPMKYLGNDVINSDPEMFSMDMENIFDKALRNWIFKDELDDVFAINKAMQYMMKLRDEGKYYETIMALERTLQLTILGRTQASPEAKEKSDFISKNRSRINY